MAENGLPNRIREHRMARRWTLEHVALELGCSIMQVSDLERGNVPLTDDWMRRIALVFDLKASDLLLATDARQSLASEEEELLGRYRRADADQRAQLLQMAKVLVPDAPARRSRAA